MPKSRGQRTAGQPSRRGRQRVKRLALQSLEPRHPLTAVAWMNPAGGAWDVGSNWSTGSVPSPGDEVTIDTASALTITIQSSDSISVNSVTSGANDTLSFSGGSLTVAAASALNGPLTMTGGSLHAMGSGAQLIANGATSIDGASLYASAGGKLSLPTVTTYVSNSTGSSAFQADGSGSQISVSALATLTEVGAWYLSATNGAEIDIPSVSSLSNSNGASWITDTGGSKIVDGKVTSVSGGFVSLDGTDSQMANSWRTFHALLSITGGDYNLPLLTDIDNSSFYVIDGGQLVLPNATSVATFDLFEAEGTQSRLDISRLASVPQGTSFYLNALNGGELDAGSLTSLTSSGNASIVDTGGSRLLDGKLTDLAFMKVTLDGTDPQATSSWTQFIDGSLTVTGGMNSLPMATDVDGSSLLVQDGGSLSLPELNSYDAQSQFYSQSSTFQATGTGSVLNLPALTTIANSAVPWNLSAVDGGEIELTGLTSLNSTSSNVTINDNGKSTILDGKLTSLSGINAAVDGTDPQFANSWTAFTNGDLSVTGGSVSLPGLTDIDGSSLHVSNGATLALPTLTNYIAKQGSTLAASGSGSVLDLSALTSISALATGSVNVTNGGEAKLTAMTSINGHGIISIDDTGGSKLLAPHLTNLTQVDATLDGSDQQVAANWIDFTGGRLTVVGGSYSLPALMDVDGSSVFAESGGSLALPSIRTYAVTSYDVDGLATFKANGPGSLLDLSDLTTLTGGTSGLTIYATGGGELKLNGLTRLAVGNNNISIIDTGGSTLAASNLTELNGVSVRLDGTDPHLADSWTTFTAGKLTVLGGSQILPNLTDMDGSRVDVQNGGAVQLPLLKSFTGPTSSITIENGGSLTLDNQLLTVPGAGRLRHIR